MNDTPHRNLQNLPKIGAIYSTVDEKQRVISEEILLQRIKPELKLKINLNILHRGKGTDPKEIINFDAYERRLISLSLSRKVK